MFQNKIATPDMSCKIVPHKPPDGSFAKCALREERRAFTQRLVWNIVCSAILPS
jgi:hypothetical protein